jgi:hypothetical protein
MKLTSVELHPQGASELAVLSFRDPSRQERFSVEKIFGLDVDEIIPRYYSGSGGSNTYYELTLQKREITVRIGLNPNFKEGESFEGLRDTLYRLISSSRNGKMHVHLMNGEDIVAHVTGFVTKIESPNFEKEQKVQLTIKAEDPVFRAMTATVIPVVGLDPGLTEIDDPLSNAPHGFKFTLAIASDRDSIIMTDPDNPGWNFTLAPVDGFSAGDVLHFSSEHNNKYIYIVRGLSTIQMADAMGFDSVWPVLFPGVNKFSIAADTGLSWTAISHFPSYWGV